MDTILENLYKSWSKLRTNSNIEGDTTLFDRYKPETILGIGGTSVVIAARDTNLERTVAIKILNPDIGTTSWGARGENKKFYLYETDYFRREAQMLARLQHPNLCEIYEFGISDDGIPWLAMELFRGEPLRELLHQWISASKEHTVEHVLTIARQMAAVVDFLHRSGLYQLDIKPENTLVSGSSVKVIDIASGLEKPTEGYRLEHARYATPGYVAPEIVSSLDGKDIGPASDVFSLGVNLMEMCCLHNPLASEDLRRSAYEALRIVEVGVFMDLKTGAFIPDWNAELQEWGESYTSELLQLDVRKLMRSASIRLPEPLIDLATRMMALPIRDRPRDGGEVLRELISMDSRANVSTSADHYGEDKLSEKRTVVLFLAADPTDATRLRLGEELREIQEKLRLARQRDQFDLEQRMSVRSEDISQALLDTQPQFVHFSGHGSASGALCFENRIGQTHPIQPDALAALFEQFSEQVDCVLLNACFSESQAKAIAEHIEYVIGMNQAIGDKAAIAFAIGFYQALGAGRSIEEAYKFGAVQIRLQGIPEDLTPILINRGAIQS